MKMYNKALLGINPRRRRYGGINVKNIVRLSIFWSFLTLTCLSQAQVGIPTNMDGLFMVYPSGSITSFSTKSSFFSATTYEYYVYSPSGNSGNVGRVKLDDGDLAMEDLIRGEPYKTLLRKSKKYKTCGSIYGPSVNYKIESIFNSTSKTYHSDRWKVVQDTVTCKISNVRHHSDGNWCESWCVEWNKGYDPSLKNMRLYSSKLDAIKDSKGR